MSIIGLDLDLFSLSNSSKVQSASTMMDKPTRLVLIHLPNTPLVSALPQHYQPQHEPERTDLNIISKAQNPTHPIELRIDPDPVLFVQ